MLAFHLVVFAAFLGTWVADSGPVAKLAFERIALVNLAPALEHMAKKGIVFDHDELAKYRLTLVSDEPVAVGVAVQMILAAMRQDGLEVIEEGDTITIRRGQWTHAVLPGDIPTLKELVERCISACGGEEAVANVEGTVREEFVTNGIRGRIEVNISEHNSRICCEADGVESVMIFRDGRLLWRNEVVRVPHCGGTPHLLLLHLRESLRGGEVLGRREFMGEAAIAAQPRTGLDVYYFSEASGRLIGADTAGPVVGVPVRTQYLEWKPVGRALLYTKMERRTMSPEAPYESTIGIEWNRVDPEIFEPPPPQPG